MCWLGRIETDMQIKLIIINIILFLWGASQATSQVIDFYQFDNEEGNPINIDSPANYQLVMSVPYQEVNTSTLKPPGTSYKLYSITEHKIELNDQHGKTWWSIPSPNKGNKRSSPVKSEEKLLNPGYKDYSEYLKELSKGENPNLNPNAKGTLAIRDSTCTRWMLIDKTGKEILLPPKTGAMECLGYVRNKYWLFLEYESKPDIGDKSIISNQDITSKDPMKSLWYERPAGIKYFLAGKGWALYDEDGKLFKQSAMQYDGQLVPQTPYFNAGFDRVVYQWKDKKDNTYLAIYSLDGKLIRTITNPPGSVIWADYPLPADGKSYLRLKNEDEVIDYVLFLETGDMLGFMHLTGFDVSSQKNGLLLGKYENDVYLYDFIRGKLIFTQTYPYTPEYRTWISGLNISGDGTSFSLLVHSEDSITKKYYSLVR